jgi:hypothetical protein
VTVAPRLKAADIALMTFEDVWMLKNDCAKVPRSCRGVTAYDVVADAQFRFKAAFATDPACQGLSLKTYRRAPYDMDPTWKAFSESWLLTISPSYAHEGLVSFNLSNLSSKHNNVSDRESPSNAAHMVCNIISGLGGTVQ